LGALTSSLSVGSEQPNSVDVVLTNPQCERERSRLVFHLDTEQKGGIDIKVFSPSYRFAIFKRTDIYKFAAVALLVCAWEQRMRH
jgi:hypothetical protein